MAVGKSKRINKKKGNRKSVDPFARKIWFNVKAPGAIFENTVVGNTLASKTTGTKTAEANLKGRVYDVHLGNLRSLDEASQFKVQLKCEEVDGTNCLTDVVGVCITRDHHCASIRKRCRIVEAVVEAKTTDGYLLRLFPFAVTRRDVGQKKMNSYTKTSQEIEIRTHMIDTLINEVSKQTMVEFMRQLFAGSVANKLDRACNSIYRLGTCLVRKVKVLSKPKFDENRMAILYGGMGGSSKLIAGDSEQTRNLLTSEVQEA